MGKKPIKGLEDQMEQGVSRRERGNSKPEVTVSVGRKGKKGHGVTVERDFTKKNGDRRGFNDPSWYAANPQLLKDAASFAFSTFQGMIVNNTGFGNTGFSFKPSGTASLMYVPTFGKCSSAVDALNIAVRNIYSFVRHANSGHTNYEPADLGVYLFSVIEIYGMIAQLERLYGISRVYSIKNRNMPRQLLAAAMIDPDSVLTGQAQLRFTINRLIQKVASLCIPKGFPLLQRRVWMNSYVFKDADTDKASQYMFNPMGYWKYEPTKLSTGGIMEFNYWTGVMTWQAMAADIEAAIDAVLQDEDMNIMSGDILKAYGDGGLCTIEYVPEDYTVIPVYQPEVLPQIHNADFISTYDGDMLCSVHYKAPGTIDYSACGSLIVQQVDGILMNELYLGNGSTYNYHSLANVQVPQCGAVANLKTFKFATGKLLLDLPTDSAEPSDVMVATRLKVAMTPFTDVNATPATYGCRIDEFGTEIVLGVYVFEAQVDSIANSIILPSNNLYPLISGGNAIDPKYLDYIRGLSQFNLAPICYITDQVDPNGSVDAWKWAWKYILGDIYNYTTITASELKKLHTTAVLSELSIPGTLFGNK